MKRKGDTLIEVALAIGIFSLVAITVVGVVSASLTNAQSAVEVTLTREELDAQAEALRFIHESYISGSQSAVENADNKYEELWTAIVEENLTKGSTTPQKNAIKKYNPASCTEVFDDHDKKVITPPDANSTNFKPFVINTRRLGKVSPSEVIITNSSGKFHTAGTYPRILYTGQTENSALDEQVNFNSDKVDQVQGIYIIAVPGDEENVVQVPTNKEDEIKIKSKVAYYDFYIRSCWMPLNSDRASTISTVVRLYDPAVICYGPSGTCPTI